jgi:thiamine pyrophosphate-dependent acetolactate synthase large subunit-like protein
MTDGMPDFPALAQAFGVKGVSISERDDLLPRLRESPDQAPGRG